MKKIIHNARTGITVKVDLTPEEIAEQKALVESIAANKQAEADAKTAQDAIDAQTATDKASAKVKLKAVEYTPLTDAEADALTT